MGRPVEAVETIEVPSNGRKSPDRRKGGALVYHPAAIAFGRFMEVIEDPEVGYDNAMLAFRLAGEVLARDAARAVPVRERVPEQDPSQ